MRAVLLSFAVMTLGVGCSPAAPDAGQAFKSSGEVIALGGGDGGAKQACFICHGLDGSGDGVSAPRLAGLDAGYLQKQLEDYATQLRPDGVMTSIAKRLDQNDRRAVAAYYAAMPHRSGSAAPTAAPAAYFADDAEGGVPSCASCHGEAGEGLGPGNPALAGQPSAYTLDQLRRWRKAERRNDPRGVMMAAASRLTEAEMRAIAVWLQGRAASPRPDNAAASVSSGAAAAEQSAAFRAGRRPDR